MTRFIRSCSLCGAGTTPQPSAPSHPPLSSKCCSGTCFLPGPVLGKEMG